jgi:hypothetical protein
MLRQSLRAYSPKAPAGRIGGRSTPARAKRYTYARRATRTLGAMHRLNLVERLR